jgi:hypothetical protein
MQGVIVEFQYADDFDRTRIEGIAHEARGRFEGLPGLRQKAFTLDEQNRRATNVYLWTPRRPREGSSGRNWSSGPQISTGCVPPSRSSRSPNWSTTSRSNPTA